MPLDDAVDLDDDTEPDEPDDVLDDDEDDDEDVDDETATSAELAEMEEKYRKANRRAKKYRKALASGKKVSAADVDEDVAAALAAGTAATAIAKKALARAAVLEAGGNPAAAKLIDLDELEIDDDGDLDGIDEAIDAVRTEAPELFRKAKPDDDEPRPRRRPVKRGGGKGAKPGAGRTAAATADDKLLAAFRGEDIPE